MRIRSVRRADRTDGYGYPRGRAVRAGAALCALLAASIPLTACGARQTGGQSGELPGSVKLIVPFSAGGGTDTLARVLAPALEKQVKNSPSVEVVNRPGGESITGTNKFVQQNPDDGSQLLVSSATTTLQWLLGVPEVRYDFTKLKPLMVMGTGGVIYTSAGSGIDSVTDLRSPPQPLSYGGISPTGLDMVTLLAFDLLKLDPKVTFGFEGRGPARLALQRGETNLDYQTTSAYLSSVQPLAKEGKVVPLMTFGVLNDKGEVVRDPNFPDLPTVVEVYEKLYGKKPSGAAYDAYVAFLAAAFSYQKGVWATPETPQQVREAFISAVPKLKSSAEFEKKRKNVLGNYPIYSGDEVRKSLRKAYNVSDEVRGYIADLLESKYDTTIK